MGILNLTPDSFSDGGLYNTEKAALRRVEVMLEEGADIIDIGGYSSRPNATDISAEEELRRIEHITLSIIKEFPEAIISIDTFRSTVATSMLDLGVHMINDISGSRLDSKMLKVVAEYQIPYILMHMKGTPQNMQQKASYSDLLGEMMAYFVEGINIARNHGIRDIIVDPGFGFGKSIPHNYTILQHFQTFSIFDLPVLAGISRKSMLYKSLNTSPQNVIAACSALHLQLLKQGANILRVHDIKEAVQVVDLFRYMKQHGFI